MRLFNICSSSEKDVHADVLVSSVVRVESSSKAVMKALEDVQNNLSELGRVGLVLAKQGPGVNVGQDVGDKIRSEVDLMDQHRVHLVGLETMLQAARDQLIFLKTDGKKPSCLSQSRLSKSESVAYASLLSSYNEEKTNLVLEQHQSRMLSSDTNLEYLRSVVELRSSQSSFDGSSSGGASSTR